MGGVFVNYRTGDGEWAALLIDRELKNRFGADQVFYASRSIQPGDDFAREIERRLANSDVLLAVIGDRWLETDAAGRNRIDDPDDWVRHEIRTAFAHDVRVIPVLLDDTPLLPKSGLPEDIAPLANCQYLRLRHHGRDDHEVTVLVNELTRLLPPRAAEPWRVRVRDGRGTVRGAGVLLSDQHVFTCAQVVAGATEVIVEFVGLSDSPRARARVVPEWCVPSPADHHRGDVALLQLDRRLPTRVGATLRRAALSWDRDVHLYGFPRGQEGGVYIRTVLRGSDGPNGDWLPMNINRPSEHPIGPGFLGAGVVDERTGHVLGIVVGDHTDDRAWMIPTEAVLGHVSRVAEWVTGHVVADEVFSKPTYPDAHNRDLVRLITEWLARRDTGESIMIITGAEVAGMYRAVELSSRERRTDVVTAPEAALPAVGSIDLAVDASGKSSDEVSLRILDRAGIPLDSTKSPSEQVRGGVPPMTIVVDGVDSAAQPAVLLNDVLRPLAESDSRLVLGFREESSPSLTLARSWNLSSVGHRLTRLAARIDQLEAAEARLMSLRAHVNDPEPVSYAGSRLSMALGALRAIATESDPDAVGEPLERCERKVARALRRAGRQESQLLEALREREALRGCLGAYQAKANDEGLVEDITVAEFYGRAHELLWHSPTDLPAARQAVEHYLMAIRQVHRLELERGRP